MDLASKVSNSLNSSLGDEFSEDFKEELKGNFTVHYSKALTERAHKNSQNEKTVKSNPSLKIMEDQFKRNYNQKEVDKYHMIDPEEDQMHTCRTILDILQYGIPSILTLIFENLIFLMNLALASTMENGKCLAAVEIGNTILTLTLFPVIWGFNGALETFVSKAYGAKKFYVCGCYLNRARVIQIFLFPLFFVYFSSKYFVYLVYEDRELSEKVQSYLVNLLPGIFAYTQYEVVKRFLQNIGQFKNVMYLQCSMFFFHVMVCYILVFKMNFDEIEELSTATSITCWVSFIAITCLCKLTKTKIRDDMLHFDVNFCEHMCRQFMSGFYCACIYFFKYGAILLTVLISEFPSDDHIKINSILANISKFYFAIGLGMSYSVSHLVGSSLGKYHPKVAFKYCFVATIMIIVIGLLSTTLLVILRGYVPLMFTHDEHVQDLIYELMPAICVQILFEMIVTVHLGSVKALGIQRRVAFIYLAGYWVFVVPIVIVQRMHSKLDISELWVGIIIGNYFINLVLPSVLYYLDWRKISIEALDHIQLEGPDSEDYASYYGTESDDIDA